ncbi:response regulator [Robiginitalea sp. M366]|uniref:response regulator n=1 Tax=Robiginitalea aestuariiviva TaxID=3036903 RepID=UPI00240E09C7|nr:response regulator [Robiginitalea aestuariiviva]MDG1572467.1 response regulator [Robiginitalea aestuariiviva]
MSPTLNCILLIDDDEPTNFMNSLVLRKMQVAAQIHAVQSGQDALDYLTSEDKAQHPKPDLIFLDINMPGMNGWEFLEEYKQLDEKDRGHVVVVMLTTSLNPDDRTKADTTPNINEFHIKPLTADAVREVLEKHFGNK